MALAAGTRLGPYEILEPLGAGGMGEVYRARDPRLKREVALKVLPAELASEPERLERFQREAETLAALNHPHIVTIFSVEEAEEHRFLTMELVEGKTLARVIPRSGLPVSRLFQIAIPLAEAVSAAHEKGIIHRDLKPGNVMVTEEDRVKVLDFGLAKLREGVRGEVDTQSPTEPATGPGRVLGTAPYMSPEQVQGKALDHRSDVFALGIMLYEMATGERPFGGETFADVASSILKDNPVSVTERKADLPRDLGKLIKHCLEKEPRKRFQSTLDLANELEELRREVDTGEAVTSTGAPITTRRAGRRRRVWLVGGAIVTALALAVGYLLTRSPPEPPPVETASAERKMLVVLPFENLGAPEDAYFAAGMTEEITSRLARVSGLGVISRTSAVQYDRTGKTTTQLGADLGVGFVLEGTVRWDRRSEGEGRVRITPQLIRVADDTHMWAESYDRVLDDVFAIQSDIARAVVDQLGVSLLASERQALEERPTNNEEAHQAYLRGLDHGHHDLNRTKKSTDVAIRLFQRAFALDSSFVQARARLAEAHMWVYWFGWDRTPDRLSRARVALDGAIELDPDSPDVHRALGWYHYQGARDYERAVGHFTAALARSPSDIEAREGLFAVRRRQGRFREAIAECERALGLDPRNPNLLFDLGETHWLLREYAVADRFFEAVISIAPDKQEPYRYRARNYLEWTGATDRSRDMYETAPGGSVPVDLLLFEGDYEAALAKLATGPDMYAGPTAVTPRALSEGHVYRFMGRDARARESFEAARLLLEKWVQDRPEDWRASMSLAVAYAGLGRKTDAVRYAERATQALPLSTDAYWGPHLVITMALVDTMVGEYDAAIDQLEYVMSIPSRLSVWELRLHPYWDPLREHPRFKKLVGEDWQAETSP